LKYSAALAFGAFGLGCIIAFFLNKMDKRLRTPNDAALCTRLPLIGTITSSNAIKPALFAEQITSDYQAIRANLGLLSNEGMPRKLVVTSPGTQEGKTTFCINLATSLARSGKRVLLIGGDMRKPDVVTLMNSPEIPKRSHKVTDGDGFDYTIYTIPSNGLDILVPHCEYHMDAYELVSSPSVAKRVDILAQKYDHVIIDTPPTLAFPDALEWAKIAKNVLLVSFAGRTTAPDLAEARQRLATSGVRIVGTVMNNVSLEQSYRRYGYDYYYQSNSANESIKYTMSSHLLTTSESQREDETGQ
jgi:capsular exopolysaccharide synthesis family protein